MRRLLILAFTLSMISCNFLENKQIEKQRNDSIVDANLKLQIEYKRRQDSIKHLTDSIETAKVEKARIDNIKSSIRVTSYYLSKPNSVGGCDVHFYYINKSNKIIKYLFFDVSFKNNVDDFVVCKIRKDSTFIGKDTGPVKKSGRSGGVWSNAIYNWSATRVVVNSINIQYMDGSELTIKGLDLILIGLKEKQINNDI